ncbi:MAG: hypothetical protein RBS01_04165, partial [Candidatus Dojkabacteria bacterium]|nr:hypothetical protein [Candidatus Dojkabacteria bacterium]
MNYYISVIVGWLILFLLLYGIGDTFNILLKRFFKFSFRSIPYKVLIGFCIVLLLLGLLHFFFPLNIVVLISLLGISSFSIISLLWRVITKKRKTSRVPNLPLILIVISSSLLTLLFLNGTFGTLFVYDYGFYYLQILEWYKEYPLIVGLSNIHGRLGFNNSSFLLFPIFEDLNLIAQDSNWVNTGLGLFTIFFSLWNLYRVITVKQYSISKIFLGFIWLPICIYLFSNDGRSLVSISPDNYVFYLQLILTGTLLSFRKVSNYEFKKKFFLVLLLSATLFTIKLSGGFFGIGAVLLLGVFTFRRFKFKQLLKYPWFWFSISIASLIVIITVVRSFLLSGYPFYPSGVLEINPKWSVGKEVMENELCFIKSWARDRSKACVDYMNEWEWFKPWFSRLSKETVWPYLMVGSLILMIFSVSKKLFKRVDVLGIHLILISSTLYWFVLAPDPRFALGIFWSFILLNGSIIITKYKSIIHYSLFMDLIILVVLLSNISFEKI